MSERKKWLMLLQVHCGNSEYQALVSKIPISVVWQVNQTTLLNRCLAKLENFCTLRKPHVSKVEKVRISKIVI